MTDGSAWRPTAALRRALVVSAAGVSGGVLLERPAALVLAAPFLLLAVLGLLHRPAREPRVSAVLDHETLHEGQGTTSRLTIDGGDDAEQVTRVPVRLPFVAGHPAGGISRLLDDAPSELELSPRRWGRRTLGAERVALTTPWAGYRWGPVSVPGREVWVLPTAAAFSSRGEAPHPRGLVGAHRSARTGAGTEFSGIRGFEPGDRLRRINWRVSARTDRLHVTTTRAEEDTGLLLVVDAAADLGTSGGLDGAASSLDLTVRAAAAIAEHAVRQGDRVALRVVGGDGAQVDPGSGRLHLRRILGTLAGTRPRSLAEGQAERMRFHTTEGTVVVLLSPLLGDHVPTAAMTLLQRGVPTLVVDTLPVDASPEVVTRSDLGVVDLAWRMRLLEREHTIAGLVARGCPVVAWRGPGTLDEVLRRLVRHAALPQRGRR